MKITSFAFAAVCLLPIGTVFGQQSGSGAAGSTKSALLAPNGFTFEGDCMDGRVFSGQLAFKEQGDKLFVKIVGGSGTCEAPVELSGDKIEYTGCSGAIIKVAHSPSNAHQPFKGRLGAWCDYFLKPK